jgi:hypothetical protein
MSMLSSRLSPSGAGGRGRPGTGAIIAIVVGALILFGVGTVVAWKIKGGSTTNATTGPSAQPCVTTSLLPAVVLPKPGTVTANVYNATTTRGLAKRTAATLGVRGFKISKVANDPLSKTITGVAEIRHGPKGLASATLLRYYFPGAVLVADSRTDATIDVAVGDAFTEVATAAQVQAALNTPVPVPSGSGCSKSPSQAASKAA